MNEGLNMKVYLTNRWWKIFLMVLGGLIFMGSVLYTNALVRRIAKEEQQKALLWVRATRRKAALVKYTNELFEKMAKEEQKKGRLWAKGVERLVSSEGPGQDLDFIFEVVKDNETVPVILVDAKGKYISSRNLDPRVERELKRNPIALRQELQLMAAHHPPIEINILNKTKNFLFYRESVLLSQLRQRLDDLGGTFISDVVINSASIPVIFTDSTQKNILAYGNLELSNGSEAIKELQVILQNMQDDGNVIPFELPEGGQGYIYYRASELLTQLRFFPFIQFTIIGLFLAAAYILFNTSRRAEQDRVWAGMAKETAHQLGTPISSLMAWVELLKFKLDPNEEAITEIAKDVQRLEVVAERFSKIGSEPKLHKEDLSEVLEGTIDYLRGRVSQNVTITINYEQEPPFMVWLNVPLFSWVVENITRNAVDAMVAKGDITFDVSRKGGNVIIDVTDTGKGIPKSKFKTVFDPGFTTKTRGWGLGLSLVRRIVEDYHHGKVFVHRSEVGVGTTFRIVLDE